MKVTELFERCMETVQAEPSAAVLRYMHETLVLACAEALRGSGKGFGNLMAQTDYLCKEAGMGIADRIAVQTMRRHSNRKEYEYSRRIQQKQHSGKLRIRVARLLCLNKSVLDNNRKCSEKRHRQTGRRRKTTPAII